MPTATELVEEFVSEHMSVRDCLQKGLINYSALARAVIVEFGIEKEATKEAISIAAIRLAEKLKGNPLEEVILKLMKKSNVEIKNNIVSFNIDKGIYPDSLIDIEKEIKKHNGLFFAIEGSSNVTLIVQKQSQQLIEKKFKKFILNKKENRSLISIISPGIEDTPGAVKYISSLFFEKGINIDEFMSCYENTIVVIDSKDLEKVIKFLNF